MSFECGLSWCRSARGGHADRLATYCMAASGVGGMTIAPRVYAASANKSLLRGMSVPTTTASTTHSISSNCLARSMCWKQTRWRGKRWRASTAWGICVRGLRCITWSKCCGVTDTHIRLRFGVSTVRQHHQPHRRCLVPALRPCAAVLPELFGPLGARAPEFGFPFRCHVLEIDLQSSEGGGGGLVDADGSGSSWRVASARGTTLPDFATSHDLEIFERVLDLTRHSELVIDQHHTQRQRERKA